MSRCLIALALGMSLALPAFADPGSSVTIPLAEYLKLNQAHQHVEAGPPITHIFSAGMWHGTIAGKWLEVSGDVTLKLFDGGWAEVPLLPSECVLKTATLDGTPLSLYEKDGQHFFIARGAGEHKLHLIYDLNVSESGVSRSLQFHVPPSAVSNIALTLPDGRARVSTSPPIPLTATPHGNQTRVEASLPGNSDSPVTISWRVAPTQSSNEPVRIDARLYTLVSVAEKETRVRSQVVCSILRREVDHLTLRIPPHADVAELTCPGLAGYKVTDADGQRQVNVTLQEPTSGNLAISLALSEPQDQINSSWELPHVEVVGAEQVQGAVGIESNGGIEVTPLEQRDARQIDVKELPAEVSGQATSPLLLAYVYHKAPHRIEVQTHKGEEVAVLTATIDAGQGVTLLTPDGKIVSTFSWQVRNNLKQFLAVKLPQGSTLWSAYVNGQPVKPVKGQNGELRLSLLRSPSNGDAAFPVEVTYVQEGWTPSSVGNHQLLAPSVDIPISQLTWSWFTPPELALRDFSGSMQAGGSPVSFAMDEVSGKVALDGVPGEPKTAENYPAAARAAGAQLSNMVQNTRTGVFPVRVLVPQVGQIHTFTQLMVAGAMPTVEFSYYRAGLEKQVAWTMMAVLLLTGLSLLRRHGVRYAALLAAAAFGAQWLPWAAVGQALWTACMIYCPLVVLANRRLIIDRVSLWLHRRPRLAEATA